MPRTLFRAVQGRSYGLSALRRRACAEPVQEVRAAGEVAAVESIWGKIAAVESIWGNGQVRRLPELGRLHGVLQALYRVPAWSVRLHRGHQYRLQLHRPAAGAPGTPPSIPLHSSMAYPPGA